MQSTPPRSGARAAPIAVLLALSPAAHATIVRPDGTDVPDNLWPTLDTISSVVADRYAALEDDPVPFPVGEVDGFADLHVHQFSHLGFDGRVVWGGAADNSADWPMCRETSLLHPLSGSTHGVFPNGGAINAIALAIGKDPPIGYDLVDFTSHPLRTKGFDDGSDEAFSDWPVWYTWAHQQHGVDQLAQAHADGLALMVMSAVSNRVLCLISEESAGTSATGYCGDSLNIERQLIAAWQLSEDLDLAGDQTRDRDAWYQPVVSAGDANHVMAEGRLAVVLTVEGDEIFDSTLRGGWVTDTTDDAELADIVNYYGLLGVRVFQPIHEFDNLAGAAAHVAESVTKAHPLLDELPLGGGLADVAEVLGMTLLQSVAELLAGVDIDDLSYLDGAQEMGLTEEVEQFCIERDDAGAGLPTYPLPFPPPPPPDPDEVPADCASRGVANLNGLTDYGARLIDTLVDQNLVIDLAHMSRRMQHDVLDRIPEKEPLIVSHTRYQTTRASPRFDEFTTSDALATELAERGGMIGVRTIDSATNTFSLIDPAILTVPVVANDCVGSSRSAAQMFLHGDLGLGVHQALGSDFNGATTQVRPRFYDPDHPAWHEPWACRGNTYQQALQEDPTGTDFDLIGLGHIGMEGPFVEDLKAVGYDTEALFGSASDFVEMWQVVGTYVPTFPKEERLPWFLPNPGEDPHVTHEVFCASAACVLGLLEIPDLPDPSEWIDVLVEYNREGTGYDPFDGLGDARDQAVVDAIGQGIGQQIGFDDKLGRWATTGAPTEAYQAFNDDITLNLDGDPSTHDTILLWPGTFNKDGSLDFDYDVSTADQPVAKWGGGYNLDGTLDLDADIRTLDSRLGRDVLAIEGGK